MKIQQNVRGATGANDSFIGADGQFTIDSERREVRLHDGHTPGGHRILNLSQLIELFVSLDSELGSVQFSPEEKGFLTRIDDKAWALRGFQAGNGIQLTNPFGTAGNTAISVSSDYVSGVASGLLARRMNHFVTAGEANALVISLAGITPDWAFGDGVFFSVAFHAQIADDATLKVGVLEPLPLLFADGVSKFNGTIRAGTRALLVLSGGAWWILGHQNASMTPINPIEALPGVGTVQDALSALRTLIGSGGGGGGAPVISPNPAWTFPLMVPPGNAVNQATHPIADGEARLITYQQMAGGGGTVTPTRTEMLTRIQDKIYSGVVETVAIQVNQTDIYFRPSPLRLIGTGGNYEINITFQVRPSLISPVGIPVQF